MITRECKDCGRTFKITSGEERHYKENNLQLPLRCRHCRHVKSDQLTVESLKDLVGKWVKNTMMQRPIKITKIEDGCIFYRTILDISGEDKKLRIFTFGRWSVYSDPLPSLSHVINAYDKSTNKNITYYSKSKIDKSTMLFEIIAEFEMNDLQLINHIELEGLIAEYDNKKYQVIEIKEELKECI